MRMTIQRCNLADYRIFHAFLAKLNEASAIQVIPQLELLFSINYKSGDSFEEIIFLNTNGRGWGSLTLWISEVGALIIQHMDILLILIIVVFGGLLIKTFYGKKKQVPIPQSLPGSYKSILTEHVEFYRDLDVERKKEFEQRMQSFLSKVRITGIGTTVEDLDKALIAASAIIPIFGFHDWEYLNLNEVLLYPDSFNERFEQEGKERHTLGVVGDGSYQNIMILSKHELRNDFLNKTGKDNTAIHEFIHLIDKTDGAVDGIPEFLLSKKFVLPWIQLMQREINQIVSNRSDINPYGATDPAEFFAVVSEYFFERPELLQKNHPELFDILVRIFRRQSS